MAKKGVKSSKKPSKKAAVKKQVKKQIVKKQVRKVARKPKNTEVAEEEVQEDVVASTPEDSQENSSQIKAENQITNSQEFVGQSNSQDSQTVESPTVDSREKEQKDEQPVSVAAGPETSTQTDTAAQEQNVEQQNQPRQIELGSVGELPMEEVIPHTKKKSSLAIWIILSIVLLLIIFGTLAYFIFFK